MLDCMPCGLHIPLWIIGAGFYRMHTSVEILKGTQNHTVYNYKKNCALPSSFLAALNVSWEEGCCSLYVNSLPPPPKSRQITESYNATHVTQGMQTWEMRNRAIRSVSRPRVLDKIISSMSPCSFSITTNICQQRTPTNSLLAVAQHRPPTCFHYGNSRSAAA